MAGGRWQGGGGRGEVAGGWVRVCVCVGGGGAGQTSQVCQQHLACCCMQLLVAPGHDWTFIIDSLAVQCTALGLRSASSCQQHCLLHMTISLLHPLTGGLLGVMSFTSACAAATSLHFRWYVTRLRRASGGRLPSGGSTCTGRALAGLRARLKFADGALERHGADLHLAFHITPHLYNGCHSWHMHWCCGQAHAGWLTQLCMCAAHLQRALSPAEHHQVVADEVVLCVPPPSEVRQGLQVRLGGLAMLQPVAGISGWGLITMCLCGAYIWI